MDKNEDLDLLELQELALKHKTSKRQKTLEEKRMIVRAYLSNHVPIPQLCANFGISKTTFYRWFRTFADGKVPERISKGIPNVKPNPPAMPKKLKPEESAAEELARLREENKRLSEALKMAEWMNHAKDVMIDEAEKAFNIPIRKKSGAKLLPASGHVRQATAQGRNGDSVYKGYTKAGSRDRWREAALHVS